MIARISLRVRLTLAFALAMALVLAGLGGFLYARLGAELLNGVDLDLRSRAGVIVGALERHHPAPMEIGQNLIDPDEAFAQILDSSGHILQTTDAVSAAPMIGVRGLTGPTFFTTRVEGVDDEARLLAVPTRSGIVVVGAPLGDRQEALDSLLTLLLIGGPWALALSSAAGWLVAAGALRPVERMRKEAAAISELEPNRRLPVPPAGDELTELAVTVNAMLDRLHDAAARQRRFVDEASHELRTPLAILKSELDLALARPRTRQELELAVQSASRQTDTLVRLAEDLLVLARTRHGRLPVHRTPVRLGDFLRELAFEGVTVSAPDETVRLDPLRVRQAVGNLLDNAVRHGHPPISVLASRDGGTITISVEDDGPGFPPDLAERAFEPFVSGPGGGAGLGLAIVKAVAESHAGTATLSLPSRITIVLSTADTDEPEPP
ncbi:ATP-binding protein [Nonomuraea sediminis]|uniref:ATP-binding protein n=1 Tax=Nonomuraea sediminis TaxID=2835864 RepID=UPI001BDC98FC|nr:ATP-binding protein [Nonomuraea sediminis]